MDINYKESKRTYPVKTRLMTTCDDITMLKTEAIVNAANSSLLGGGGVDGAIHSAAGPDLLKECRLLDDCKIGESKITKGYHLKAMYVIHTVGPIWHGGTNSERELLASYYRCSLKIATFNSIKSIAFPCISTGNYGFPAKAAAEIAVKTVREFIEADDQFIEVIFCCLSKQDFNLYQRLLNEPAI